jgi:hypothetical protein
MRNFKLKYLLFIFLFLVSIFSFSQDTIVKFTGDIIQAKITEITSDAVKYKKFDFQDGPLYVVDKSEIKMIKFSNGLKEEYIQQLLAKNHVSAALQKSTIVSYGPFYKVNGLPANEKTVQTILLDTQDKKIEGLVSMAKQSQRRQYIGFVAFPLGLIGVAAYYTAANNSASNSVTAYTPNPGLIALSGICFLGTITCPIISGVYKQKRNNYYKAAIKVYNEKF